MQNNDTNQKEEKGYQIELIFKGDLCYDVLHDFIYLPDRPVLAAGTSSISVKQTRSDIPDQDEILAIEEILNNASAKVKENGFSVKNIHFDCFKQIKKIGG